MGLLGGKSNKKEIPSADLRSVSMDRKQRKQAHEQQVKNGTGVCRAVGHPSPGHQCSACGWGDGLN